VPVRAGGTASAGLKRGAARVHSENAYIYMIAKAVTVHPIRPPTCSRVIFAMGMAGRQARLRAFACTELKF